MPSSSISPTAHFTGYVWHRHGLSHPGFDTVEGRVLYAATWPVMLASRLLGGATLEDFLLARHRRLDALLAGAVERGEVTQIIEVAAGMSPRGLTFARRFGGAITYIEADLPGMAARKRAVLGNAVSDRHRVVELDALAADGPQSLAQLASELDRAEGLAIVTEGLLNYFPRTDVEGMWRQFATVLGDFARGLYVSDLHLRQDADPLAKLFMAALGVFVRGEVHLHFEDVDEARGRLLGAGFAEAGLERAAEHPRGARLVHIVEAKV